MNSFMVSCKVKDLKKEVLKKIEGNGLTIDRKYLGIMEKYKPTMVNEIISPSQQQLSAEEAYKISIETEDIYLNSNLSNEAALRQAIRKFNNEKGDKK